MTGTTRQAAAPAPAKTAAPVSMFANPELRRAMAEKTARLQATATFTSTARAAMPGIDMAGTVLDFAPGKVGATTKKPGPSTLMVLVTEINTATLDPMVAEASPEGGARVFITGTHWMPRKPAQAGGAPAAPNDGGGDAGGGGGGGGGNEDPDAGIAAASFVVPPALLGAGGGGGGGGVAALGSEDIARLSAPIGFVVVAPGMVLRVQLYQDFDPSKPPARGDRGTFSGVYPSFFAYPAFTDQKGVPHAAGVRASLMAGSVVLEKGRLSIPALAEQLRARYPLALRPFGSDLPPSRVQRWPHGSLPARSLADWSDEDKADEEFTQRAAGMYALMVRPGAALGADDDEATYRGKWVEAHGRATHYGAYVLPDGEAAGDEVCRKTPKTVVRKLPLHLLTTCVNGETGKSEQFELDPGLVFDATTAVTGISDAATHTAFFAAYGHLLRVAGLFTVNAYETARSPANRATGGAANGVLVMSPIFTPFPGHKDYSPGQYVRSVEGNLEWLVRAHGFRLPDDGEVLRTHFNLGDEWTVESQQHVKNVAHQVAAPKFLNLNEFTGSLSQVAFGYNLYVLWMQNPEAQDTATAKLRALVASDPAKAQARVASVLVGKSDLANALRSVPCVIYAIAKGHAVAPGPFDGVLPQPAGALAAAAAVAAPAAKARGSPAATLGGPSTAADDDDDDDADSDGDDADDTTPLLQQQQAAAAAAAAAAQRQAAERKRSAAGAPEAAAAPSGKKKRPAAVAAAVQYDDDVQV